MVPIKLFKMKFLDFLTPEFDAAPGVSSNVTSPEQKFFLILSFLTKSQTKEITSFSLLKSFCPKLSSLTLPGLVTDDFLSPKDFSFFRGRSWYREIYFILFSNPFWRDFLDRFFQTCLREIFYRFSREIFFKTCSGEITEDCVRNFGWEFFLINGRSWHLIVSLNFKL